MGSLGKGPDLTDTAGDVRESCAQVPPSVKSPHSTSLGTLYRLTPRPHPEGLATEKGGACVLSVPGRNSWLIPCIAAGVCTGFPDFLSARLRSFVLLLAP